MHQTEEGNRKTIGETVRTREQAYQNQATDLGGACCATTPAGRRSTLCEEAEKRSADAHMEGIRASRAAIFFREHPDFDEFIQLIRAGVIHI